MTKRIVLCADDYGQASAISGAIINLIQSGRLSATSCMVNSKSWAEHAKWLIPFLTQIDIGLHFNLTEGQALSPVFINAYGEEFLPLSSMLVKSVFRQLDQSIIEAELNAQLDTFQAAMGFLPVFIDGHQHVHQFPFIRDAVIAVYQQRLKDHNVYVRLVDEKLKMSDLAFGLKKIVITLSGTMAFKKLLIQHEIPHNQSFAGIYPFSKANHFGKLFTQYLREIGDGGIIMCHPGLVSDASDDAIAKARYEEYQYLSSSQFLIDCHSLGAVLSRFAPSSNTVIA